MIRKHLLAVATIAALTLSASASAAKFEMINRDAPGIGLNDPTPVAPVGGNPGTTRGAQAQAVYRYAMALWGNTLESDVPIIVDASFAPLNCTATSGTLAQAGANWIFYLTSAGQTRIYGSALADSLIGFDLHTYLGLDPNDRADIVSQFNGRLGQPGCLEGMGWYFGLDGNTPAGKVNFLNVVMHELAHGLGAQGFLNKSTGSLYAGYSDPYTQRAYDNVLGLRFEQMTAAQRATAMRTPGRTVWVGPQVNATAALILNRRNALQASAPGALAGKYYDYSGALFGPLPLPANFPDRPLVVVDDGIAPTSDGCSANGASTGPTDTITYVNAAAVAGNIAVIDRGTCSFEYKVKIAQDNGAVAVIVVNNAAGTIDMGAASPPTNAVTIPSIMVSQADGAELKANIAGARAGLGLSPFLAGADQAGRVRLYSPTTVAGGSTFSHFDTVLVPDALMEPFDSPSVRANVSTDLTPSLFADIGWRLKPAGSTTLSGAGVQCSVTGTGSGEGGLMLGGNLQAASDVCGTTATSREGYYFCMKEQSDRLVQGGLLTEKAAMKFMACARRISERFRPGSY